MSSDDNDVITAGTSHSRVAGTPTERRVGLKRDERGLSTVCAPSALAFALLALARGSIDVDDDVDDDVVVVVVVVVAIVVDDGDPADCDAAVVVIIVVVTVVVVVVLIDVVVANAMTSSSNGANAPTCSSWTVVHANATTLAPIERCMAAVNVGASV